MHRAALLIDFDGVLRLWPKDYASIEQSCGLPIGAICRLAFRSDLLLPVITGSVSDRDWRSQIARILQAAHPLAKAAEAVDAWSSSAGAVDHDVKSLLQEVRAHCTLVLTTNATDRLPVDLAALGLSGFFDHVVNSSELRVAKPEHAYFQDALRIAGVNPVSSYFVDDSAGNVAAAAAIGITSHRYTSASGLRQWLVQQGFPILSAA